MFKTRVTEILGTEYPLIMGTMQPFCRAELVAAANAGAFVEAAETATVMAQRSIGDPIRVLRNEAAAKVLEMCNEE